MGHRPILLSHIKSFQYSGCSPKYSNEERLSQAEIQLISSLLICLRNIGLMLKIDTSMGIQLSRKKSFHFQYFGCSPQYSNEKKPTQAEI